MSASANKVTLEGNPVKLSGVLPEVGEKAPDFTVVDGDLNEVSLDSLKGKTLVINSVVSLDTPVCDVQMRRFNEEAARLGDAEVIVVSMDLPFAQKRWCGAAGAERIRALSDHRDASFAEAFVRGELCLEERLRDERCRRLESAMSSPSRKNATQPEDPVA